MSDWGDTGFSWSSPLDEFEKKDTICPMCKTLIDRKYGTCKCNHCSKL